MYIAAVYPSIPSRLITQQQKVAEHIRISDAVSMTTATGRAILRSKCQKSRS